jgi:shikimate dehydrogenase
MIGRPDQYAVVGNPISHSKSPQIHSLFAAQTGQHLEYRAILVEPGGFAAAADAFRALGGKGLNVTVPFKQDAWIYAELLTARAERAGAVNTLMFKDNGEVLGENTDGPGLIRDLCGNHGSNLKDKRILLLGAGGAARGVLQALLDEQPASVGFPDLQECSFDLIINATAAGLNDTVPPLPEGVLAGGAWCYDLLYGDTPTAFVRWAQAHGAACALDGLGMLVEQAAESFYLWRGVRPATMAVIRALREG